ncbi:MAG: hypothetical protein NT055_09085 [Nitrospirae bacterium]|nr:hypothetical protein [Nitrospirota bacterium]
MPRIARTIVVGQPYHDDGFMLRIEELLGRRLVALPWGRPRKAK